MHPFFIYLIQVNIALILFYLLYAVVLKRDTFFQFRRFFFLSVIAFSFLYPFFTIPGLNDILAFRPSDAQEVPVEVLIGESGTTTIKEGNPVFTQTSIPWNTIFCLLYITVTLVFIVRFTIQCISIYRIKASSEKRFILGIPVYHLKEEITPFSFFNRIFIHTGKHSEVELSQILLHEQTHVLQRHTIDILLIESLCLFSWWNPFVWLIKREMAMNLEYLADHGVLREGIDSREYQYHLLRLTYQESDIQIINNFNVSQLKQRIMMMNKSKSPSFTVVKYILIVPLFFLIITANSMYAAQDEANVGPNQQVDENLSALTIEKDVSAKDDDKPQYPGGYSALMKYLSNNGRYPVIAQENEVVGRVVCSFVIKKDGSIDEISVLQSVDPSLDKEVIRLIEQMPKWEPAAQQAADVKALIPVVFRLQYDNEKDNALSKAKLAAKSDQNKKIDEEIEKGAWLLDELVMVGYGINKQKTVTK